MRVVQQRADFRSVAPRATPGLLYRELLPVCGTESESYSRFVAQRATPSLSRRELPPACCTESYPRSVAPRATPGLWHLTCRAVCLTRRVRQRVPPENLAEEKPLKARRAPNLQYAPSSHLDGADGPRPGSVFCPERWDLHARIARASMPARKRRTRRQ
jgi:hypothetical protein